MLSTARHIILGIIDFFHKPFAWLIPTQTFRYLACGGSNAVLNIIIYHISLNYLLKGLDFHIYGNFKITALIAAWIVAFCISFPAGFILSRHIVFPESNLHGRVQFFRYALATATFILLSYTLIKVFAFCLPMVNPTVSYTIISVLLAILSYISQRKFTFKIAPEKETESEEQRVA